MSRAYYAALHWAKERVELCPEVHADTVRGGSHERVIERFRRHSSSVIAGRIAYVLQDLRNKRESADYELPDVFVEHDALQQIATAERVKRMLDEFAAASK